MLACESVCLLESVVEPYASAVADSNALELALHDPPTSRAAACINWCLPHQSHA
jgi:hypothetical protein